MAGGIFASDEDPRFPPRVASAPLQKFFFQQKTVNECQRTYDTFGSGES